MHSIWMMDVLKVERMDGSIDGCMQYGWCMDAKMHAWKDEWMDRCPLVVINQKVWQAILEVL